MNRLLEEEYYIGESGFAFTIKTGINLAGLVDGEIKGVIKRPNGSIVARTIEISDISDVATGTVLFDVEPEDFTTAGTYKIQVFVKDADAALARPSHVFSFNVVPGLVSDADSLFV